jgi:hypothetical protein
MVACTLRVPNHFYFSGSNICIAKEQGPRCDARGGTQAQTSIKNITSAKRHLNQTRQGVRSTKATVLKQHIDRDNIIVHLLGVKQYEYSMNGQRIFFPHEGISSIPSK